MRDEVPIRQLSEPYSRSSLNGGPQVPLEEVQGSVSEQETNLLNTRYSIGEEVSESSNQTEGWRFCRAAERQKEVKSKGRSPITFLPVLGQTGYIRERRSHLISAYPKGGKSTLLVQMIQEWTDQEILYLSEESDDTWDDRFYELPDLPDNLEVVSAFGCSSELLWKYFSNSPATVVVIDTVRSIIRPSNEDDAPTVSAALTPWIEKARSKRQTLIFVHHDNKHGGKGGKGISGSHAYVGLVDIFLELEEVPGQGQDRRRSLTGRGRNGNIEPLLYELQDNGELLALTTTDINAEYKILSILGGGWQTTAQLEQATVLERHTLDRGLRKACKQGLVERDPPIQENASGKTVLWRRVEVSE